jgi:restriction system protein
MSHWQASYDTLVAEKEQHNITIDAMRRAISTGEVPIANAALEVLLRRVPWPVSQPSAPRAFMNSADRLLVIDIALPAPNYLPSVKAVTYTPRTKSLSEKPLTKSEADALYQSLAYQYVLAIPFVIFTEILPALVDTIVVNGWVTSVDAQTGHDVTACILSVSVRRSEWEGINLSRVDPKECFRGLKGIGSTQLRNLTPVPPIMRIDTSDPRFVESREVLDGMDSAQNLAAMDWADFEHLIRELFAKEFDVAGGKVEVTQASRDGGVDAVAFDPDPIRGGKIIIQAKRYANTVGVSYVRDLYGTVVNEGATKGILVTTSGFGSDAYEFAKDKPLTLLGGSELLFLLQKHGYSARIDLAEARTLNEQNRR